MVRAQRATARKEGSRMANNKKGVGLMDVMRFLGCTSKEVRELDDDSRAELKASLQACVDSGAVDPSEYAPAPKCKGKAA
jgi:hypothetical protein